MGREEKREQFWQLAINAWNDYQATGLYVTSQRGRCRLAQIEDDEDAETLNVRLIWSPLALPDAAPL